MYSGYGRQTRKTDAQRYACYRWERDFAVEALLKGKSLGKCTSDIAAKYVKKICEIEGVRAPSLIFKRSKTGNSWAKQDREVKLAVIDGMVDNQTLIHELAHVIDYARNHSVSGGEGHGPSFIGVYIDMLVKIGQFDRAFLEQMARKHRLCYEYTIKKVLVPA